MAQTSFTVNHQYASDYKGKETDSARLTLNKIANFIMGLAAGSYSGTSFSVSQDPASATVTLSGVGGTASTGSVDLTDVGGTAASGTVTLGGGAGDVTIVTDGTSVGPVAFNTSDAQTALDCITALNANGTFAAKATASDGGSAIVLITWDTKGTVGNSKTLTASRTAGTATASGATLASGAQGSVGVTVGGTLVTTDTTNLTDTAAATAVAAALNANSTVAALIGATGNAAVVELVADAKGVAGDAITLSSTSATGTATSSAANLENGVDGEVTVTVDGTAVVSDTTNLTDAAAATLVAADLNADATVNDLITATASGAVVTLTANASGPEGNAIGLTSSTVTGTAISSSATLTGGTEFTYTL